MSNQNESGSVNFETTRYVQVRSNERLTGVWFFLGIGIGCLLLLNGFLISLIALGILKWQGASWVPEWIAVMPTTSSTQVSKTSVEGPLNMTGTLNVVYPEGTSPVVVQLTNPNAAVAAVTPTPAPEFAPTFSATEDTASTYPAKATGKTLSADDMIMPRPKSLRPRTAKVASRKKTRSNLATIRTRKHRKTSDGLIQIDGSMFMAGNEAPAYPLISRLKRQEGVVVLELDINADGTTDSVEVVRTSGSQLLDQAAVAAEQRWLYRPGYAGRARKAVQFQLVGAPEELPARYKNLSVAEMQ